MDDDWWEEPAVFFGFGSMHEMNDRERQSTRPRLAGLKSVSEAAMWAMHREKPEPKQRRHPMGFRRPK